MISRNEIADMSIDELSELLSCALMIALVKGGEADRIIPDGFKVDCETENLKFRFDIDVKIEAKESVREAFKNFSRQQAGTVHLFKPGEL